MLKITVAQFLGCLMTAVNIMNISKNCRIEKIQFQRAKEAKFQKAGEARFLIVKEVRSQQAKDQKPPLFLI